MGWLSPTHLSLFTFGSSNLYVNSLSSQLLGGVAAGAASAGFGFGISSSAASSTWSIFADEDELELVLHLGRHLVEVGLVALGDDDALDARAVRREDLLLRGRRSGGPGRAA